MATDVILQPSAKRLADHPVLWTGWSYRVQLEEKFFGLLAIRRIIR
jgi:hypothetical protein